MCNINAQNNLKIVYYWKHVIAGTDPETNQRGVWLRFKVGSFIYYEHYHSSKIKNTYEVRDLAELA